MPMGSLSVREWLVNVPSTVGTRTRRANTLQGASRLTRRRSTRLNPAGSTAVTPSLRSLRHDDIPLRRGAATAAAVALAAPATAIAVPDFLDRPAGQGALHKRSW